MGDTLTSDELVQRLRDAGRAGGRKSSANKRERRRRYLDNEMGRVERAEYEKWIAHLKEMGKRGGWPSHKRNRALVAEARGEQGQVNGEVETK